MSTPDLDAIQARWDAAQKTLANDPNIVSIMQLHRLSESADDVQALLALVRSQQAQIERVRKLAESAAPLQGMGGMYSGIIMAEHVLAALTATEGAA